jgi:hypothetical protein
LNGIQDKKMVHFEFKQLSTCPEPAVKGCALILIEHCLLNPDEIHIFASIIQLTILSSITNESRKKLFLTFFVHFFYLDMEKSLKPLKPEASNWQRVSNIGKLLCALYDNSTLDFSCVQVWLSLLEKAISNSSIEARNEMKICIEKVGQKFVEERPNLFQNYVQVLNAYDQHHIENSNHINKEIDYNFLENTSSEYR